MSEAPVRIEALSPEERLELLERLWDSLSRTPASVPLTDPQRVELDRRLDALDDDASQGRVLGVPWDEVVRHVLPRQTPAAGVEDSAVRPSTDPGYYGENQ